MTLCNCGKCRICTTIKKYPLKPKKKPSPRDAPSKVEGAKVEGAKGGVGGQQTECNHEWELVDVGTMACKNCKKIRESTLGDEI